MGFCLLIPIKRLNSYTFENLYPFCPGFSSDFGKVSPWVWGGLSAPLPVPLRTGSLVHLLSLVLPASAGLSVLSVLSQHLLHSSGDGESLEAEQVAYNYSG